MLIFVCRFLSAVWIRNIDGLSYVPGAYGARVLGTAYRCEYEMHEYEMHAYEMHDYRPVLIAGCRAARGRRLAADRGD
jgi:hypothetical protein